MYCIGSKIAHIHIIYLGHNICDGTCIHVVYISNEDFMHYNNRQVYWVAGSWDSPGTATVTLVYRDTLPRGGGGGG